MAALCRSLDRRVVCMVTSKLYIRNCYGRLKGLVTGNDEKRWRRELNVVSSEGLDLECFPDALTWI